MSQCCALTAIKAIVSWTLRTSQGNYYSLLCGIYKNSSPKIFTWYIKSKSMWQVRRAWGTCVYSSLKIGRLKGDHISVYSPLGSGKVQRRWSQILLRDIFWKEERQWTWDVMGNSNLNKGNSSFLFCCLLGYFTLGIDKGGWTRWPLETSMNLWLATLVQTLLKTQFSPCTTIWDFSQDHSLTLMSAKHRESTLKTLHCLRTAILAHENQSPYRHDHNDFQTLKTEKSTNLLFAFRSATIKIIRIEEEFCYHIK